MNVWGEYQSRLNARGRSKRESMLQREYRFLTQKMRDSLSFHQVLINGEQYELSISSSDSFDIKTICTLPGKDLPHGGVVEWMGYHWLITSKDADNSVYAKAQMRQCNYIIKWISQNGAIVERWCIIEDGTNYTSGESTGSNYIVTQGDSKVVMTVTKDSETISINRDNRFLVDDYDSPDVLAYRVSKPLRLGGSYDSYGIVSYVLQECNTEDTDNLELHIANYYKYFDRDSSNGTSESVPDPGESSTHPEYPDSEPGKKVWI